MSIPKTAVAERQGVNPQEGKRKYGNVTYADSRNKRYPIDTPAHVRAALSYWGMPKNRAKYSSQDQAAIGGRIHAAARRMGIGTTTKKTAQSMEIQTLEEFRETLADPEAQAKVDEVIKMIGGGPLEKAGIENGTEWHTQQSISDVPGTTHSGINPEDPDPNVRHEFLTPEGAKAAGEGEEEKNAAKENDGDEDDKSAASGEKDMESCKADSEKASEGEKASSEKATPSSYMEGFEHLHKAHGSMHACHKAIGDGEHALAQDHASAAIQHCMKAQGCFQQHGAYQKVQKGMQNGREIIMPNQMEKAISTLSATQDEIIKEMGRFAARIDNEFSEIKKWMDRQPASRGPAAETVNHEIDYSPAIRETIKSRQMFQRR